MPFANHRRLEGMIMEIINTKYKELKDGIKNHLNAAAEDFFIIGYCLRKISENALFAEDGYKNIWEFARGEYGLSTSSTSRFMAINVRFSIDGGEHMDKKYAGMGVSKLQEMLTLPDEELEKVTKETTVREIRAMKAQAREPEPEPLSFYGLPATKRAEGSLLSGKGCGDGKHDCFLCCRTCGIRQQDRFCRTAPMGNPFPCSQMDDNFKDKMAYSLYRDQCQHLHQELAPISPGSGEPDPCCLTCDIKCCLYRCDVAKKRDEQKQKEREAEERRKQREAEEARPEPDSSDIKAFYEYKGFKLSDNITADWLKERLQNTGGSGNRALKDYRGSGRGVRINYKRELTYTQLAKALNEYQGNLRRGAGAGMAETEPEVMDVDFHFQEVNDEPKKSSSMTDKEKLRLLKEKEPELIAAFYKSLYPGEKAVIRQRDPSEITRMLKREHGNAYDGGRNENGFLWNCYPDKINLSISGLCLPLQITWGKFTTKLLTLLEKQPELEAEPDEDLRRTEKPEANRGAETGHAEAETAESQEDPEAYTLQDVKDLLRYYEQNLQAHRDAEAPIGATRKQRIIRDALRLLFDCLQEEAEV